MKLVANSLLLCSLVLAGCTNQPAQPGTPPPASPESDVVGGGGDSGEGGNPAVGDPGLIEPPNDQLEPPSDEGPDSVVTGAIAVPIISGTATLSPDNTKILFTGTHQVSEPDPNARTGGFERFSGTLTVDEETSTLKSISVEIETDSLWTPIAKLTNHLKNTDFLETRQFPSIVFRSASVQPTGPGEVLVAGELTLHGVTKVITFPAKVSIRDGEITLSAEFVIDRTDYGMDLLTEQVRKEVALRVIVGEKTKPVVAEQTGGRGR